MLIDLHFGDWSAYLVRWIHLITGISWIGSSFYFMWLDAALEKPVANKPDVEGELWMVHSGGFYEVERKKITAANMPKTLHWFKYEALFTWTSGICLLGIVYYGNASAYMIDPSVANLTPAQAVGGSLAALAISWFLYDGLWQTVGKSKPGLATGVSLAIAAAFAFLFCHFLSGRAAFIHMGAMFGTWMVANVWVRILPAQQKMIDATREDRPVDYAHSGHAKRRSVHNTYMTFPVLFMMLSNHYAMTYSGQKNYVMLILLILFGASVRHVMVAKEGKGTWAAIPAAISLLALVALSSQFTRPVGDATASVGPPVPFSDVHAIIQSRCVSCHSKDPVIKTFGPMPGGISFETNERIHSLAARIKFRAVITKTMPMANMTKITEEERTTLGRWIDQGAKVDE
ncbi:MAG: urate hydroxylase PuuD [Bdellovibrionales bacterium]|nr:urate hydroxylase PuuD [Bdellovibrionales bacterium]